MTAKELPPWLGPGPSADDSRLDVLVAPRASREKVGPVVGDRLRVAVTAPALEGKANAAVSKLLARAVGARRADVTIVVGGRSKRKTVQIVGVRPAVVAVALAR